MVTYWSLGPLPEWAAEREFSTWLGDRLLQFDWTLKFGIRTSILENEVWDLFKFLFLHVRKEQPVNTTPFIAHHSRTRLLGKRNSTTCNPVHRPVNATRVSGGERILYLTGDVKYEIAEDDW